MKYGTILWSRRRRHSITQPLRVPTPPERCSIGMMDLRGTVNEITRFCQALLILKRIGKMPARISTDGHCPTISHTSFLLRRSGDASISGWRFSTRARLWLDRFFPDKYRISDLLGSPAVDLVKGRCTQASPVRKLKQARCNGQRTVSSTMRPSAREP
jgi:hypothetical protein